jgi:hypothetical protein
MKPIILGKAAAGGDVKLDLRALLVSHMLLQAASGGGKSRSLRRLAEQCVPHVQTIIIDPEGEFSTLRERFDFLLVGENGETPADVRTARSLAVKLRELRVSAICDLFSLAGQPEELSTQAGRGRHRERHEDRRHLWVREFLMGLLNAPRSSWSNLLLFVDEGQLFAPEKGETWSPALNAMKQLALLARKRGIGLIFATQRVGIVSNTVLSSLQNVLIGKARLDVDQERCAKSLGIRRGDREQFYEELKSLKPGRFFAQGPAIGDDRVLVHFGEVATTHPEPGDDKRTASAPPPSAKILHLLPNLALLPAAGEAEQPVAGAGAEASETKVLKAEIRRLEGELARLRSAALQARPSPAVRTETVTKVVEVVPPVAIEKLASAARAAEGFTRTVEDHSKQQLHHLKALAESAKALAQTLAQAQAAAVFHKPRSFADSNVLPTKGGAREAASPEATQRPRGRVADELTELAAAAGGTIPLRRLAIFARLPPGVSTLRNAITDAVRAGRLERCLLDGGESGVRVTPTGRASVAAAAQLPSPAALLALWTEKLGGGRTVDILNELVKARELPVEELAHRVRLPTNISTFRNGTSLLVRSGLAARSRTTRGQRVLTVHPDLRGEDETTRGPAPRKPRQLAVALTAADEASANPQVSARLVKGARRLVAVLKGRHPERLTLDQLAALAVFPRRERTLNDYLQTLLREGYVERVDAAFGLTPLGISSPILAERKRPAELVDEWKRRLTGKQRDLFDVVATEGVADDDGTLAARVGIPTERTLKDYLGNIVRLGLFSRNGRQLLVHPELALNR